MLPRNLKEQREQFYHLGKRDHQKDVVNANNAKTPNNLGSKYQKSSYQKL